MEMIDAFEGLAFRPANILLAQDCDLALWSVVACDQYTSQPEYWQRVEERVGCAPSTLRLILPECRLERPDIVTEITAINNRMTRYQREGRFLQLPDAMIYVERTLDCGKVRRGLVGMVDLERYDYEPGAKAQVRATEGTVLARIPPRVEVRKNASIELPHVMLLTDDPMRTVIEPLAQQTETMQPLYDFDLMERGGHISGWKLNAGQCTAVADALQTLAQPEAFSGHYQAEHEPVLLFAVGDGNHSLATAKECYERQKRVIPEEQWEDLPARYALCELVNLHDASLEFEPIHRVVFGAEPEKLLRQLQETCPGAFSGEGEGHVLRFAYGQNRGAVTVPHPQGQLPVGTLQSFLDQWLLQNTDARIDYIHGEDVACQLAQQDHVTAFLLPAMEKEALFPTVVFDGALPRKTFSMGEAHDKRFYLEARKIRN